MNFFSRLKPWASFLLIPITALFWWHAFTLHNQATSSLYPQNPLPLPNQHQPQPPRWDPDGKNDHLVIGDTTDNVFTFIHVSDLHVSRFYHKGATGHFLHFLSSALPLISPAFVSVTGDLTDAKDDKKVHSMQMLTEWALYDAALRQAGIYKRTSDFWFDLRGNHDAFNVLDWDHADNFYRNFSVVASRGYAFDLTFPFGTYGFVGMDACPRNGPARPFNFFAYVDSADMDRLEAAIVPSKSSPRNHTFLMSHYPSGNIVFGVSNQGATFESLSENISMFLCGHLHKLFLGLGRQLHAHKPSHVLELEIPDLKLHGIYRVVTIDHDMIAHRDVELPLPRLPMWHNYTDWKPSNQRPLILPEAIPSPPVIQITNPKDARYTIAHREPVSRILRSTHIRFFIWSFSDIKTVSITIDGTLHTETPVNRSFTRPRPVVGKSRANVLEADINMDIERVPLWVAKWNPAVYNDNKVHEMRITAEDGEGRKTTVRVPFRVDGKNIPLNGGPGELIILTDFNLLFKGLFLFVYLNITLGMLLIPKLYVTYLLATRRYHSWRTEKSAKLLSLDLQSLSTDAKWKPLQKSLCDFQYFVLANTVRFCHLATIPRAFYGLMAFCLYIVVGPWFVGELIPSAKEEGWGAMYLYGIYVNGKWVPLLDSWTYVTFALSYELGLLVWYLSFQATPAKLLYSRENARRTRSLHGRWYIKTIVLGIYLYVLAGNFMMAAFYGPYAAILSARFWLLGYGAWLLWCSRRFGSFEGNVPELVRGFEDSPLQSPIPQRKYSAAAASEGAALALASALLDGDGTENSSEKADGTGAIVKSRLRTQKQK